MKSKALEKAWAYKTKEKAKAFAEKKYKAKNKARELTFEWEIQEGELSQAGKAYDKALEAYFEIYV